MAGMVMSLRRERLSAHWLKGQIVGVKRSHRDLISRWVHFVEVEPVLRGVVESGAQLHFHGQTGQGVYVRSASPEIYAHQRIPVEDQQLLADRIEYTSGNLPGGERESLLPVVGTVDQPDRIDGFPDHFPSVIVYFGSGTFVQREEIGEVASLYPEIPDGKRGHFLGEGTAAKPQAGLQVCREAEVAGDQLLVADGERDGISL